MDSGQSSDPGGENCSRDHLRAIYRRNAQAAFSARIRPTQFNYPVDIFGKWHGSKYSFITRHRSGFAENLGEEFNSAFTRLDHLEQHLVETRFDVMWHRHTGQWFRLHTPVTLEEALHLIETDGLLHPVI